MTRVRLRKFLWIAGLALTVLVIAIAGYIHIEQARYRHRTEELIADLNALELRKTGGTDVQQIVQRWGFEKDEYAGRCTAEHCAYRLVQRNLAARLLEKFNVLSGQALASVATLLGDPAMVSTHIEVRQNMVWSREISLWIWIPRAEGEERILRGIVSTQGISPSSSRRDRPAVVLERWMRHPDYLVGRYRGILNADTRQTGYVHTIWVEFSPEAASEDVSRLMVFNLQCLTQFRACREEDLMPAAWRQYVEDQQHPATQFVCTPELSKRVASLADAIIVIRIDSAELTPSSVENAPLRLMNVHMVRPIKGPDYLRRGLHGYIEIENPEILTTADTSTKIRSGEEYIFLMQIHTYGGSESLAPYPCGVLTLNPGNLAMAREAAAESGRAMGWIADLSKTSN
jgi:hypothetical protein